MIRDRAGRAACHRVLEHPQAPLCLGPPAAPSQPASPRYRSNAKIRIDLADAPLKARTTIAAALIEISVAASPRLQLSPMRPPQTLRSRQSGLRPPTAPCADAQVC